MKKKLLATLVAGAVLSVGLIGLTACGGGLSINKGEEVDEAGWKAAFTATAAAQNLTIESYNETEMKLKGSGDEIKEECGVDSVDMSVKTTSTGKIYYSVGVNAGSTYSDGTAKVKTSGVPDKLKENYSDKEYKTEAYTVKNYNDMYMAYYDGSEKEAAWKVNTVSYIGNPSSQFDRSFATEKGGTISKVSSLYSAFTYKNGVYTATLYTGYDVEYKVSVSIKGDYIVGYSLEYTENYEESGYTESMSEKTVYNLSAFGDTEVKPSDAAKNAIDDYKANN